MLFLLFLSCGTQRHSGNKKVHSSSQTVKEARKYLGTPYRYGGESKKGIDCSGLLWNAYRAEGIQLPRVSREQAEYGKKVSLKNAGVGDAIFFKTSGRRINHAGIIDHITAGEIFFIHASSSKGVMVSSLNNSYWKKRFAKVVRY